MSVLRFIFFKYYDKDISFDVFGLDILKAFFLGVRYDLAVLAYLNMPVTLAFSTLLFFNKMGVGGGWGGTKNYSLYGILLQCCSRKFICFTWYRFLLLFIFSKSSKYYGFWIV
jgi:hypothetical protein